MKRHIRVLFVCFFFQKKTERVRTLFAGTFSVSVESSLRLVVFGPHVEDVGSSEGSSCAFCASERVLRGM